MQTLIGDLFYRNMRLYPRHLKCGSGLSGEIRISSGVGGRTESDGTLRIVGFRTLYHRSDARERALRGWLAKNTCVLYR